MNSKSFAIPMAIVLAGIVIAGAIIYSNSFQTRKMPGETNVDPKNKPTEIATGLREVNSDDHIIGNPNAKLSIIEFSDTECPFCKIFHETMNQIMEEYGKDGTVRWVYRHFPLDNLHKKARKEAEATECASDIGGKQKFWDYINRLYEITPSNDGLKESELTDIAKYAEIDETEFTECLESGKFAEEVEKDYRDGVSAGVTGTPHVVIVTEDGEELPIKGAASYDQLKSILDKLLESPEEQKSM